MLASVLLTFSLAVPAAATGSLAGQVEVLISAYERQEQLLSDFAVGGDSKRAELDKMVRYSEHTLDMPVYFVPLAKNTQLQGVKTCPLSAGGATACLVLVDNSRNGANGQLSILAHELAHQAQGSLVFNVDEREVWAETIAWLVMKELGLDLTREAMSYLFQVPYEARRKVLTEHEAEIRVVVARLVKAAR